MKNTKFIIKTKSKTYPIYFGNEILETTGKLIKKNLPNVKNICIIIDKNVPTIFHKKLNKSLRNYKCKIYKLSATEKTKSFGVANKLIESLIKDTQNLMSQQQTLHLKELDRKSLETPIKKSFWRRNKDV